MIPVTKLSATYCNIKCSCKLIEYDMSFIHKLQTLHDMLLLENNQLLGGNCNSASCLTVSHHLIVDYDKTCSYRKIMFWSALFIILFIILYKFSDFQNYFKVHSGVLHRSTETPLPIKSPFSVRPQRLINEFDKRFNFLCDLQIEYTVWLNTLTRLLTGFISYNHYNEVPWNLLLEGRVSEPRLLQVLFHEDGSVKGIATNDVGIAKDGSPKVRHPFRDQDHDIISCITSFWPFVCPEIIP